MPVSLLDIARATGLSTATVSRALSGKKPTAPETKRRVLDAARKLGYQPSALLSKAFSLARNPGKRPFRETLALILDRELQEALPYELEIAAGADARSESMGYKVEKFYLPGHAVVHRRLSRILRARGIRGLIIAPRVRFRSPRLFLDWKYFAAVEVSRTLRVPGNLHRVERPLYFELLSAYHLLNRAGFRRIGLVVSDQEDTQRRWIFTASFRAAQERSPGRFTVPPMKDGWSCETFARWLKEHKPDVLITGNATAQVAGWLEKLRLRIPRDISLFSTNAWGTSLSGYCTDFYGLGTSCVEMLSLLLEQNSLGLSSQPRSWMQYDLWQPGTSLKYPISQDPLQLIHSEAPNKSAV